MNKDKIDVTSLLSQEVRDRITVAVEERLTQLFPIFEVIPQAFDVVPKITVSLNLPGFTFSGGEVHLSGEIVHLQLRETHKYRDGWSHLDNWDDFPYALHLLASKRVWDDQGESFTGEIVVRIENTDTKEFFRVLGSDGGPEHTEQLGVIFHAIADTLGGSRCRHEHDCCGCVSTSVNEIRSVTGEYWVLQISGSRNI